MGSDPSKAKEEKFTGLDPIDEFDAIYKQQVGDFKEKGKWI